MATWTKEGVWKPLQLKTDYEPKQFLGEFPGDREVERDISFKITTTKQGKKVATSVVNGKKTGNDWVNFTIKDTTIDDYPLGFGLDILAEKNNFEFTKETQDKARKIGVELTKNGEENRLDPQRRIDEANRFNTGNKAINDWSQATINKALTSPTGSYVQNRSGIQEFSRTSLLGLVNEGVIDQNIYNQINQLAIDSYRNYYSEKRLVPWDAKNQGLQPPTGAFDENYYINEGNLDGNLAQEWRKAQSVDDLDIIGRYGSLGNFAWNHYSTVGKSAGYRGNPVTATKNVDEYEESFNTLTDAEKQFIREGQLGLVDTGTGYAVDWADNTGSFLEAQVGKDIGEEELKAQDKFGGITTDLLKTTVDELKKAQAKQRDMNLYNALPGFSEVFNINASLSNSLLGDSGLGGYLGLAGINTTQFQRDLEEKLEDYTGISKNYATYDWNKWFDNELTERYENIKSVGGKLEADRQYEIDQEYRQRFIDEYIKPRFDGSKSMDEFTNYITTLQDGQNVFDTSSASNALKELASKRAEEFYSGLKNIDSVGFNVKFYTNPDTEGVNEAKKARYETQKQTFAADWKEAKQNKNKKAGDTGRSWGDWAYYYGIDLDNKQQFAKLHYEVIGIGKGFDPAKDVVTQGDVKDFVNTNVLTALADADVDWDAGQYLAFVTPEEFADSVIEGIDPETNKSGFRELLDTFGLGEDAGINTVKDYLTDAFASGEAKAIRESIVYLNQKKIKPTQKDLGITYIERAIDDIARTDPEADQLYSLFSKAGYGGTMDEFYSSFMPDADRTSLNLITKTTRDGLQLKDINAADPFEALSDLNRIFGTPEEDIFGTKKSTIDKDKSKETNYFDLFGEKEKEAEKKKPTFGFNLDTSTDYYDDMLRLFK